MYLTCLIDNNNNRFTLTGTYYDIDDRVDVNETGTIAEMGAICYFYHQQGCVINAHYDGRNTSTRMHFGGKRSAECA